MIILTFKAKIAKTKVYICLIIRTLLITSLSKFISKQDLGKVTEVAVTDLLLLNLKINLDLLWHQKLLKKS